MALQLETVRAQRDPEVRDDRIWGGDIVMDWKEYAGQSYSADFGSWKGVNVARLMDADFTTIKLSQPRTVNIQVFGFYANYSAHGYFNSSAKHYSFRPVIWDYYEPEKRWLGNRCVYDYPRLAFEARAGQETAFKYNVVHTFAAGVYGFSFKCEYADTIDFEIYLSRNLTSHEPTGQSTLGECIEEERVNLYREI